MTFTKSMWACWKTIAERLCHREGNEARCTCSSNCCDTIVICRGESQALNDCLPKHSRQESDQSGQWQVRNAIAPPARGSSCTNLALGGASVPELPWPDK